MKELTYSSLAAARLRANKRQYGSLVLGIFLSLFLVSTLVLSIYGIYLATLASRYNRVGYMDMVVLDESIPQSQLEAMGLFDQVGHVYLSGVVTDKNLYMGSYDAQGAALMNLKPLQGRLPETAGEIALERTALDILDVEVSLGDSLELNITPIDGTRETRSFTVVGFLPERSVYFELSDHNGLYQMPALVINAQEPALATGRPVTHYLLGLRENVTLSEALESLWGRGNYYEHMKNVYGLSLSGQQMRQTQDAASADHEVRSLVQMALLLAAALLLGCGIGISNAMEGMLSRRREEIGVLRALGATRRQIRRMFGRENGLLALLLAPASIGASCGAVWLLSRLVPKNLVFGFQPWLLLPIVIFGVAVILLSGMMPLVRASRQPPMGVLRDTAMLRRSKGVKFKKQFSPARLISARFFRLQPAGQLGASVLVGLMLLCAGLFVEVLYSYGSSVTTEQEGFSISGETTVYQNDFITYYERPSISYQSLRQLQQLEGVRHLKAVRYMTITMELDWVPRYAFADGQSSNLFGALNDAQFQEALTYFSQYAAYMQASRESSRQSYLQFLDDYNIAGQAYPTCLVTMDLTAETLDMLQDCLDSGKIDPAAIHAGQEVIVVAPELWYKELPSGGSVMFFSQAAAEASPNGMGARKLAWNDSFTVGQTIPLLHLYKTQTDGPVHREDATVTVGAVAARIPDGFIPSPTNWVYIITTEQGLQNLGFRPEGLNSLKIYLDGEISQGEEQLLERRISAIIRRYESYTVTNKVASHRENLENNRRLMVLITALVALFFSVSVGMIVSSVTRKLHNQGQTVGMLRAVGADEKTILGCYSGQISIAVAGGMGIGLGGLLLYRLKSLVFFLQTGFLDSYRTAWITLAMVLSILLMGAICWLVCRFSLRKRIREMMNKSIIENIREL